MKYCYYHFNDMKRRPPKAAVSSPFFQHCLPLFWVSLFLLSCLLSQNFLVIIWMYCFQLYVLRKYVSGYQRHTNDSYLHVFNQWGIIRCRIFYTCIHSRKHVYALLMPFETQKYTKKRDTHTRQIILIFFIFIVQYIHGLCNG